MADLEDWGPSQAARADTGPARARLRLSFLDIVLLLWRAKWLMIAIGLPLFLIGLLIALQSPKTYDATSRLLVRGGDEVRVLSTLPDGNRDVPFSSELVVQSELEILHSPVVAERTLARFPMQRLYPDLAEARTKALSEAEPSAAEGIEFFYFQKSREAFEKQFRAGSSPNNPVISVGFQHEDAGTAAEVLNAAIAAYLNYRSELYGDGPLDKLTRQRKAVEGDLLAAEDAIRTFLSVNDIGDFNSERETAQGLFSTLSGELLTVRSNASAAARQLATVRNQLADTSPEVSLFVEDSSEQTLLNLRVEREQLLARYTEDSRAVQNIDRQIAQVEAYLQDQAGPSGLTRTGPNPTYQALEASLNSFEAEAQSLAGQRAELETQLAQIESRLALFSALEAEWNETVRRRDLLEASVRTLAEREQQAGTIDSLTREDSESIRVLEAARAPIRGSSMRLPIAVMAMLFAGFTALIGGLLYVFTRRGLPGPNALERSTGLPVVGVVGRS